MFFRKKRAAEKAARAANRQHILDDIDKRLKEADALKDPGEKILKLKKLEDDIEKSSKEVSDEASGAVFGRGFRDGFGVFSGSAGVSIWLACSINPWFLALMIPGCYLTGKIGSWSADRLETRRYEENKEFFGAISARTKTVRDLSDSLIKNDWSVIAKSPRAQKIFQEIPRLRDIYAASFCKGVSEGNIRTADPRQEQHRENAKVGQDATVLDHAVGATPRFRLKKV